MWAVHFRHPEVLRRLVAGGAEINRPVAASEGQAALHHAASIGDEAGAVLLLELGADPRAAAPKSLITPLCATLNPERSLPSPYYHTPAREPAQQREREGGRGGGGRGGGAAGSPVGGICSTLERAAAGVRA
jgi:ankyrin repeat protein